jgi:hypothetical protein
MQTSNSFSNEMSRKPEPGIIRVMPSDDGFVAFRKDGQAEELRWFEVERVSAYKVDCLTYDMIWLAFERRGHREALHIQEEAEGFQDLMSALGEAFPEIIQEWYFNVMQPAFAENLTILFERKAEPDNSLQ